MATSGDWSYSDKGLDQREQPGRSQPKANEAARHSFHNRRPSAAPPTVMPFWFPLILYRRVVVSLPTSHDWDAGIKRDSVVDSACNTLD